MSARRSGHVTAKSVPLSRDIPHLSLRKAELPARGSVRLYLSEHKGDARPDTLIHLYVKDVDVVAAEFGVLVDDEGLAGRECALVDPDGNRLRVATRRS